MVGFLVRGQKEADMGSMQAPGLVVCGQAGGQGQFFARS
jgi:hypothetical protein